MESVVPAFEQLIGVHVEIYTIEHGEHGQQHNGHGNPAARAALSAGITSTTAVTPARLVVVMMTTTGPTMPRVSAAVSIAVVAAVIVAEVLPESWMGPLTGAAVVVGSACVIVGAAGIVCMRITTLLILVGLVAAAVHPISIIVILLYGRVAVVIGIRIVVRIEGAIGAMILMGHHRCTWERESPERGYRHWDGHVLLPGSRLNHDCNEGLAGEPRRHAASSMPLSPAQAQ
mmetsp:Transcript_10221/g.37594  ORF Transcript_10221/g.37594 Transcript_10221/m.37594 type:complete len:231 (+) Transcript_10221:4712-5404(+)